MYRHRKTKKNRPNEQTNEIKQNYKGVANTNFKGVANTSCKGAANTSCKMELQTRAAERSYKKKSHKGIADRSCKRKCKSRLRKGVGKRSWKQKLQKGVAKRCCKRMTKRPVTPTKQEMQKIIYFRGSSAGLFLATVLQQFAFFVILNEGVFSNPLMSRNAANTNQIYPSVFQN